MFLGDVELAQFVVKDAQVVQVSRAVDEETAAFGDPQRLLEVTRALLEAALVLIDECQVVVRRRQSLLISRPAVGADDVLEVLARGLPLAGPERDDSENGLRAAEVAVAGRIAKETIRQGRGAVRGTVPPLLVVEDRQAQREPRGAPWYGRGVLLRSMGGLGQSSFSDRPGLEGVADRLSKIILS
jgi:hypothetical protein